jgi:tRNA threonylcarbamoyl adenosine modification protein YeaZ
LSVVRYRGLADLFLHKNNVNDAPLILSLETATLGGSVYLGRGSMQLATREGDAQVSQSSSLLTDINDSLEEAGVSLREVELFACASGPGSFTGLRIGIATLKALAASLKRPCVGIPTLQAVAHAAASSSATVALLPAGRGEVFAQMFSVSEDGTVTELDVAAHLSPPRLVEKYAALTNLRWAGGGAHLQREFLQSYAQQHGIDFTEYSGIANSLRSAPGGNTWELAAKETNLAKHVASLAVKASQTGRIQSPHSLSAIYVRPSDAELKERCP